MRVLQLNAVYKTMSTGRLTYELHHYFKVHGIESYVGYAQKNTSDENDPNVFKIGNKLDYKLHALLWRIDKHQGCHSVISTEMLLKKIEKIKPDVVLTHNLHSNYVHVDRLIRGLHAMNIPVVLALHDCWFLTGGCYHYTAIGCNGWLNECSSCPEFGKAALIKYKNNQKLFADTHPVILALSKWIEREAKRSVLNENCRIEMVYNWIDLDFFYPRKDTRIRKHLGIEGKIMILGVATSWGENKGIKEMIELAMAKSEYKIVIVGRLMNDTELPENIIKIPFTESKDELAELYSAADIFFNPSKQESFGLVSAEALACGTPIIVYNTTACPEFVTEDTGVIIDDKSEMLSAVERVISRNRSLGRDEVRKKCRQFATDNFHISNIDKIIQLLADVAAKER